MSWIHSSSFLDMISEFTTSFIAGENDVLQTSQLAKIFMWMQTSKLSKHKGKLLDELLVAVADDTNIVS